MRFFSGLGCFYGLLFDCCCCYIVWLLMCWVLIWMCVVYLCLLVVKVWFMLFDFGLRYCSWNFNSIVYFCLRGWFLCYTQCFVSLVLLLEFWYVVVDDCLLAVILLLLYLVVFCVGFRLACVGSLVCVLFDGWFGCLV